VPSIPLGAQGVGGAEVAYGESTGGVCPLMADLTMRFEELPRVVEGEWGRLGRQGDSDEEEREAGPGHTLGKSIIFRDENGGAAGRQQTRKVQ